MHKYQHLEFYILETRGKYDTDTYVFLPTKFELPTKATANCAMLALEEFTKSLVANDQLPFPSKYINNATKTLRNIIAPNRTDKENISLQRVNLELSEQKVSPSRVAEANDAATPKVRQSLRLAQNETSKRHLQIYTREMHVYKKFGRKYY